MNAEIKEGQISLSVEDLFGSLSPEDKTRAAKQIGADVWAWKFMAEAVADPDGHFNGEERWWVDGRSMNEVRERLLPLMPEVARIAAVEWQQQVSGAKAEADMYGRWAWAMYHAAPDAPRLPPLPKWVSEAHATALKRDAAPEMFEVLEDVARACAGPPDDGPDLLALGAALVKARAALSKAKGEQSK